jgi:hypothetical protein
MPANPSADGLRRASRVRIITAGASFSPREKLRLLALNAIPLAHVISLVLVVACIPGNLASRFLVGVVWLLLPPPLLARLVLKAGLPQGEIAVPSDAFFRWWTTWQLQSLFNRLPWLEELLRLIPGAYSGWLRMWGAEIGQLTLWSPGVRVLDRPLVRIGDDVVVGIDARLVGHFGGVDGEGRSTFTLGPIEIGDRCVIGAASLLGPGVTIDADQSTEVLFLGTPFTHWREGSRQP